MTEHETPEKSNQHFSPGATLSKAREARQLAVVDAARELRLSIATIEHIEADRFERIAPIYRRGYIANYARLVGLDPVPLLQQMGELEPEPLRSVLPVQGKPQRFDRFLKFATYALVTTMIVPPLVYFFVLGGARLFESELASQEFDGNGILTSESSKPGYRQRFADALAVQPAEATGSDASHLSASALPMNQIRSTSQPETLVDGTLDAEIDETESAADPMTQIELVLSDDSWVEIESADGERLEFDLLRSGESRQYSGRAPFKLLLGRGSAVALNLDGEPLLFDGHDEAGVAELVVGESAAIESQENSAGGQVAD